MTYFDLLANKPSFEVVWFIYLLTNQLAKSKFFFYKLDLKALSKLTKTHYFSLYIFRANQIFIISVQFSIREILARWYILFLTLSTNFYSSIIWVDKIYTILGIALILNFKVLEISWGLAGGPFSSGGLTCGDDNLWGPGKWPSGVISQLLWIHMVPYMSIHPKTNQINLNR